MIFKKESFGLSSFVIVVETELNALKSNKHIIYSSLLTPILYYVFYAIGIQSTFGDIYFHGQYMSFLSFAFAGILIMCLFQQMDQSVYRLVIDKRWNILPIKLESGINPECYVLGISTLPFVVTLLQLIILLAISMITESRLKKWCKAISLLPSCLHYATSLQTLKSLSITCKRWSIVSCVHDSLLGHSSKRRECLSMKCVATNHSSF